MKQGLVVLALAALALLPSSARAELCTIDAVPAATLLLPYFEVDLDNPDGVNTYFSINNASAEPTVAHVTLWGDWSLPTINFDVFLTGYDVETISLRSVFSGNLPITAHATNDPSDIISPHGGMVSDNPDWDSAPDNPMSPAFADCNPTLPLGPNPALTGAFLNRIRWGHTGLPLDGSSPSECVGADHGDNVARGYITIDNVTDCTLLFPNSPANYFGAGGVDSKVNQLWGDWFIVDFAGGAAQGDNLVHVEADPNGLAFAPGDYTFYGRYVAGLGTDQREPLATTWAARYLNGGGFDGGTSLSIWRDSKCQTATTGYLCTSQPGDIGPPWLPLAQTQVVAFDLAEQAAELCGATDCFPLETQRATVGVAPLDPPYTFGWIYFNLNHTLGDTSGESPPCSTDGLFGPIAQSWVSGNMSAFASQLTIGVAAQQLASACLPSGSVCDVDGDACQVDDDCDDGATTVAMGDFCPPNSNPTITFTP